MLEFAGAIVLLVVGWKARSLYLRLVGEQTLEPVVDPKLGYCTRCGKPSRERHYIQCYNDVTGAPVQGATIECSSWWCRN